MGLCLQPLQPGQTLLKSPLAKRSRKADFGRAPRVTDAGHLAAIRQCPCLKCGMGHDVQAAHVRMNSAAHGKRTGIGEKPDDRWAVPLCREHHREQHKVGEVAFWHAIDIDPVQAAEELYKASPNVERMRCVAVDIIQSRTR